LKIKGGTFRPPDLRLTIYKKKNKRREEKTEKKKEKKNVIYYLVTTAPRATDPAACHNALEPKTDVDLPD
jgi:hypothetical protein